MSRLIDLVFRDRDAKSPVKIDFALLFDVLVSFVAIAGVCIAFIFFQLNHLLRVQVAKLEGELTHERLHVTSLLQKVAQFQQRKEDARQSVMR